jgi:hypothetical protein
MIIQYTFVLKESGGDRMAVGFTTSFAISVFLLIGLELWCLTPL